MCLHTQVTVGVGTCSTLRGGVAWKVEVSGARHCQVLAQSHSPEGGTLRCQITPGEPPHDFRACRSSHCQVLALPLTHSPEGGSQWCQITPGVPTPRLPGVCGRTCEWNRLHDACASRCGWRWKVADGVEHVHEFVQSA